VTWRMLPGMRRDGAGQQRSSRPEVMASNAKTAHIP
jgi:hypothetical protein